MVSLPACEGRLSTHSASTLPASLKSIDVLSCANLRSIRRTQGKKVLLAGSGHPESGHQVVQHGFYAVARLTIILQVLVLTGKKVEPLRVFKSSIR